MMSSDEADGNAEFPTSAGQKEQLQESMASMMQSQHLAVSSGIFVCFLEPLELIWFMLYLIIFCILILILVLVLQVGRSSGFSFGGNYSSHQPQQQQTSSTNGSGISFPPANYQDARFHGPEVCSTVDPSCRFSVCIILVDCTLGIVLFAGDYFLGREN